MILTTNLTYPLIILMFFTEYPYLFQALFLFILNLHIIYLVSLINLLCFEALSHFIVDFILVLRFLIGVSRSNHFFTLIVALDFRFIFNILIVSFQPCLTFMSIHLSFVMIVFLTHLTMIMMITFAF